MMTKATLFALPTIWVLARVQVIAQKGRTRAARKGAARGTLSYQPTSRRLDYRLKSRAKVR